MDEPDIQIEDQPEQWFVVKSRASATLAFEEWDGRVPAGTSRVLQSAPPCPICGANHTTCMT